MGRRSAPSKCFAHRAKPWRRANSLCPSIKNWVPRHALRVWDGAASQNLGQRRILIKQIKAPGVLLLLAAPRRGLFLCVLYFASSIKIPEINRFPGFLARQKGIEPPASPLGVHCAVFQVVLRHLLNPPESLLFQRIPGD